jgi:acetyl esterase/lipase
MTAIVAPAQPRSACFSAFNPRWRALLLVALSALLLQPFARSRAEEPPSFEKKQLIYGYKFGMALTMNVFRPRMNANGLGIIFVVSGGWTSSHSVDGLVPRFGFLVDRGYTVFAVSHGSQPKFTSPEILEDMHRAVRFVRFYAPDYGVDPEQLGITGGSAGGHLALMQGCAGADGGPKAKDPVDRVSSKVQAVACYFPPTDFLNYGKPGEDAIGRGRLATFAAPFDFREYDPKLTKYVTVTDEEKIREIGRKISPINRVSASSAPTLIIHGDADELVPIQQGQIMIEKLKAAGVDARLSVKQGGGHGWADTTKDSAEILEWFDSHLKATAAAKPAEIPVAK